MNLRSAALGAVAISLVSIAGCARKAPSPESASSPPAATASDLRQTARDAYIYFYPLVLNYRTMYSQAIKGDAAFGKWLHLDLSSPKDTDIVTPNNDTPYSYAWLDLRAEPWVLTIPKVEADRFLTSQWDDLWGYVLDNAGSVNDGNDGVSVLLAPPDWTGDLPPGVNRVIRGESRFLGTLTRTQVIGGQKDIPRVKAIQKSYRLQPLSAYTGTAVPPAAPAIDWPQWTEGDETTAKYWDHVGFLLPFTTPNPADQAMYDRLAAFGLKPGMPWDPASLDAAQREALQGGLEDARAHMKQLGDRITNAAELFGTREKLGTDYENRAMGVYLGIFGNVPEQSYYYSLLMDANGQPLDGSKAAYTLNFPKNEIPPVKYFWSITLYGLPDRFLVANPIDRYSIGSSTPGLRYNEDGSLTLYVSASSPGKDKESNWLPAPQGPFWTVLRTYGPGPDVISGAYKVPSYVAGTR